MNAYPSQRFAIQAVAGAGRHVLVLSGELDIASAEELAAAVAELPLHGTRGLTIDLSRLTFMDSTGLRTLLTARDRCTEHGWEFVLVPGPRQVQRVFELCGLLDLLPFSAADPDGYGPDPAGEPRPVARAVPAVHLVSVAPGASAPPPARGESSAYTPSPRELQ